MPDRGQQIEEPISRALGRASGERTQHSLGGKVRA
jgi:hypothetical protein